MATRVKNFFENAQLSLGELPKSGPVCYGVDRDMSGYVRQTMGQHYLSRIGNGVVEFKNLDDASQYTYKL